MLFDSKNKSADMDDFLRTEQGQLFALYKKCGGKDGVAGILSEGKWPTFPSEPEHEVFCSGEVVIGHQVRRSFYNAFGEYHGNHDYEGWAREIMQNPPEEHGSVTLDFCIASFEDITGQSDLLMPHEFHRFVQHPYLAAPYELIPQIYVHMIDSGKDFPELLVFSENTSFAFPCNVWHGSRGYSHDGVTMRNCIERGRKEERKQYMSFSTSTNCRFGFAKNLLLLKWPGEPSYRHASLKAFGW